ncbi:MAG: protein-L-isoaspartate(D-aspartate) O-methyltransferase [Dehalococcoidia bacterium]|nr:protein-L-isoaspartate(D-aspartate) O-methyltransferase [Dehalococcoidia bacterium]
MAQARQKLIQQLSYEIKDKRVLEIMGRVPRELFVPPSSQHLAYENIPLPIDLGQTISQPFIVALMTEALELKGNEKVLELGTGSGYQTAILAELARCVISVERHQKLLDKARSTLKLLGYRNVELQLAEKRLGWPDGAPYDAIIVTAGAPNASRELLDQLGPGGRLVIPVGTPFEQQLMKIVKHDGRLDTVNLGPVRFVPLIGEDAWPTE